MRIRRAAVTIAPLALSASALLLLGGCSGNSITGLRLSPTPELTELARTPDDVSNSFAIMSNMNWRMFREDIGRTLYTDRPSHLSRAPIPR